MGLRAPVSIPSTIREFVAWCRQTTLAPSEGTPAEMGLATLVAGTVTVTNTRIKANSRIFLSGQNSSGTHGELTVSARVVGTSFTITSTSGTDTRQIGWLILEPAQ